MRDHSALECRGSCTTDCWGTGLSQDFYARPTLEVAGDLVGKVLVHETGEGTVAGLIVEVEAYIGESDPACHAAPGWTPRNAPLYGPPGRAYVYLNYGIHQLLNAVTERQGAPAAVLLRAVEPVGGVDLMRRRRLRGRGRPVADVELCRGPGNLSQAFGVTLAHNRVGLHAGRLRIVEAERGLRPTSGRAGPGRASRVTAEWTPRIGIRVGTEHAWRCAVSGSDYVTPDRSGRARAPVSDPPRPVRPRARRTAARPAG